MGRFGGLGLAARSLLQVHRHFLTELRLDSGCGSGARCISSLTRANPLLYDGSTVAFSHEARKRYFHATGVRFAAGRDLYEVLGVSKDATLNDIKKAFHALAKKYHPDANRNNPAGKQKFQEIREAYETLRDPQKRAQYDKESVGGIKEEEPSFYDVRGSSGGNSDPFSDRFRRTHANNDPFSDSFRKIFSEIFEDESETFASDIEVELPLSFSEAVNGCTKHLSFDASVPCDSCHGSGYPSYAKPRICSTCKGVGKVTIPPFTSTCGSCKGTGRIIKEYCMKCQGSGVIQGHKEVQVPIPAGIESGDTIRVPKAGNSGGRGANSGNLIIKLKVTKDAIFHREGADIYVDAHISFTKAVLGGKVVVPTLSGKTEIKIPKGVQHGQTLVLRGKGLPRHFGFIDHGDQYVQFRIHLPSTVNDRQRTLLEEFAKEELICESNAADGNWWQQLIGRLSDPKLMIQCAVLVLILLLVNRTAA